MALMSSFYNLAFTFLLIFISVVSSSRCKHPSIRREWSTISGAERTAWVNAVKCLATLPHDEALTPIVDRNISHIPTVNTSSSYYDDFAYVHMDLNTRIHYTGLFLPWHRAYIHAFESALQTKCGYNGTQPYWNWSLNTENFFNSSIFDSSPKNGLGRNGDPNNDYQIVDGAFSNEIRAYPVPHRIRRKWAIQAWKELLSPFVNHMPDPTLNPNLYANTTFTKKEVSEMVDGFIGDFTAFHTYFEGFQHAHAGIHTVIGADLWGSCPASAGTTCIPGAKWSPNDPLFFLHHSMVDKVWYDWQHKRKANFWSFGGGSVQHLENSTIFYQYPNGAPPYMNFSTIVPSDGMFEEYTIYDMMDTTGNKLCYIYA